MEKWDCIVVGSGPAGLGTVFTLLKEGKARRILMLEKDQSSTGGLRNDCKMNFTYPIGFPEDNWDEATAEYYLEEVKKDLHPPLMPRTNMGIYQKRARRLESRLVDIQQAHLGTDGGMELIKKLMADLRRRGVEVALGEELLSVDPEARVIKTDKREAAYTDLVIAPGRKGFRFLQGLMEDLKIPYNDHIVDIGVRIETRVEHYPIVHDYYDPKFMFPGNVRTFCTNSGRAFVVKERYQDSHGEPYYSVNGHAWSSRGEENGLVNFAMLKTVKLTEPLASGQKFAEMLGKQAVLLGGGQPIMQRVGDFRMGKRSKVDSFSGDLYDFEPTLKNATPGDVALAMPSRIHRAIWKAMKNLDTIIPGVLHPSTIMYYPEIKMYANKPVFKDAYFQARDHIYMVGDGAGTSRGITGAWASGIRAARGILEKG